MAGRSGLWLSRHLWRIVLALWLRRSRRLSPSRSGRRGRRLCGRTGSADRAERREPPGRGDRPDQPELRRRLQGGRRLADRPHRAEPFLRPPNSAPRSTTSPMPRCGPRRRSRKPVRPMSSFMPTGRLDAMQKRVEGMVQAVDIVAPPLDKFYNSLSDEQKARLNAANDQTGKTADRWRTVARSATRPNGRASRSRRRSSPTRSSRPSSMRSRRRWRTPPIDWPRPVPPACRRRRRRA